MNPKYPLLLFFAVVMFFFKDGYAVEAESKPSCWSDYASGQPNVDYERAFSDGTFFPDSIDFEGKALKEGVLEEEASLIVGLSPHHSTDWIERDLEKQCEGLRTLFQPTMFPYIFIEKRERKLTGFFRATDWDLSGAATLRIYFHKTQKSEAGKAWLFQIVFKPLLSGSLEKSKQESSLLKRLGPPAFDWNVRENRLRIHRVVEKSK